MLRIRWFHFLLAAILAVIVLFAVRMHMAAGAAGQNAPSVAVGAVESGRFYSQAWCTECHSVELETAGTGKFAPDFTVIAARRSARWLTAFLRSEHKIMPDFVFSREQTDDIVAYILSLKRP